MSKTLIPSFADPPNKEALSFPNASLSYRELHGLVSGTAERVRAGDRVAVWAEPAVETCVGVLGVLAAGAVAVPINPKTGSMELEHIIQDCAPQMVVAPVNTELPAILEASERLDVSLNDPGTALSFDASPEAPALILYTSGTTGPPKGVVLPNRAITSNIDALADAWDWTAEDVVVQGLPLFHVHGLVLGVLGPLRLGGSLCHVGRFAPDSVGRELDRGGTMLFGVPTMYYRLANAAESSPSLAASLGRARLLISGSAPLPVRDHKRIQLATGQQIVERYGLTETIMNCAVRAGGDRRPGYVGPPLPGVEIRLVDEDAKTIETSDDETVGEIAVRGPNLFTEYLNQPDATAKAMRDGWFFTGDLATRAPDGYIRVLGRRETDLIKSGGFKVGAIEVEAALMQHEAVAEAAVIGEPDDDLGERIVAFVVLRSGASASAEVLETHVADLLTPHKRPRDIHFVEQLPRNEMGKISKARLQSAS